MEIIKLFGCSEQLKAIELGWTSLNKVKGFSIQGQNFRFKKKFLVKIYQNLGSVFIHDHSG